MHNLTILVKGGRHFFKVQGGGGEAKSKPIMEVPEHGFMPLIAWSLKPSRQYPMLQKRNCCFVPYKILFGSKSRWLRESGYLIYKMSCGFLSPRGSNFRYSVTWDMKPMPGVVFTSCRTEIRCLKRIVQNGAGFTSLVTDFRSFFGGHV